MAVYSSRDPVGPEEGEGRFWIANARRRDDPKRFIEVMGESLVEATSRLVVAAEAEKLE